MSEINGKQYAAYKLSEAAIAWGISEKTVRRLIQAGRLDAFEIGRTIRIDPEQMIEFCKKFPQFPEIPLKEILPRKKIVLPSRLYGENKKALISNLVEAMGEPTRRYDCNEIKLLRSPIVYAWVRQERILYVGQSRNGFVRPIDPYHHRLDKLAEGDELVIWACATPATAERMEKDLIRRFRPILNSSNGDPDVKIA